MDMFPAISSITVIIPVRLNFWPGIAVYEALAMQVAFMTMLLTSSRVASVSMTSSSRERNSMSATVWQTGM